MKVCWLLETAVQVCNMYRCNIKLFNIKSAYMQLFSFLFTSNFVIPTVLRQVVLPIFFLPSSPAPPKKSPFPQYSQVEANLGKKECRTAYITFLLLYFGDPMGIGTFWIWNCFLPGRRSCTKGPIMGLKKGVRGY